MSAKSWKRCGGRLEPPFEARFSQDASYTRLLEIYERMLSSNS